MVYCMCQYIEDNAVAQSCQGSMHQNILSLMSNFAWQSCLFLSSLLVRLKFLPAVVNHNLLYGDQATFHSLADTQHLICELYQLSTVIVSYPYYVPI